MNNKESLEEYLKDISDAIRSKTGKTFFIRPYEFPEEIMSIPGTILDTSLELNAIRNGNEIKLSASIKSYDVSEVTYNGVIENVLIYFYDHKGNLLAEGYTDKKGICEVNINISRSIMVYAFFKGVSYCRPSMSNVLTLVLFSDKN